MKKIILSVTMCIALLVGCTTPAVVQPTPEPEVVLPAEGLTKQTVLLPEEESIVGERTIVVQSEGDIALSIELESLRAELVRVTAEKDKLTQQLSFTRQQVKDSHTEYETLWETYQSLAQEKTNLYEELIRSKESQFINLRELRSDYDALQNSHNALRVNYERLQADYIYLQLYPPIQPRSVEITDGVSKAEYDSLRAEYDALQLSYSNLQNSYNTLQSTYSGLTAKHSALCADLDKISNRNLSLPWFGISAVEKEAFYKAWDYWTSVLGWLKW